MLESNSSVGQILCQDGVMKNPGKTPALSVALVRISQSGLSRGNGVRRVVVLKHETSTRVMIDMP